MLQSPTLDRLIHELKKLPGVGGKSAARIAYHFLRAPREEVEETARLMVELKERVRPCSRCGNYTEEELCAICSDPRRDESLLCVVEQPGDVALIEGTGAYRGVYHVLHGALSPLEGVRPETLRIGELVERVRSAGVREIVLATNPTVEGDATAFYIAEAVRDLPVSVTRIARGVPVGGEIEFADQVTLARALEGRRRIE
ncbi:MAG: recombination protein RecR [Candidatus Eisenbacteria bacterium]|nr:recombination protein RecR [Candidatus Eisenbacteria bacterium]